jgi:hypothetical protein
MIKDYLLYGKKDNHPNNNNNISNLIFGFCFLFLIIMVLGARRNVKSSTTYSPWLPQAQ